MFAITWRSIADRLREPGTVVLDDPAEPAGHVVAAQHLEDHVLGADPVGQLPDEPTPQICGIARWNGSPAIAIATSSPPAPIASMPSDPAAHVWLSEPSSVLPGMPKRCMCTGWLTPLPGLLYQSPKRWHALCRNRWSSALRIVGLQQVVVDVLRRQLGAHAVEAHRLELEHHHRAGRVLGEGLVDRGSRSPGPATISPSTR